MTPSQGPTPSENHQAVTSAPLPEPRLHHPAGTLARASFETWIDPETAGWSFSSLRVLSLPPDGTETVDTAGDEILVVPLSGAASVTCGDSRAELAGRGGVFSGPTDSLYVPPGSSFDLRSAGGGRFALAGARATVGRPFTHLPVETVEVQLRGRGACSREVHNICMPGTFDCERLMVCEVITPGGNWSSYPPHKHDEERPGESVLEEIYYFEVAPGPGGPGFAYQRVYGTEQRPIDLLAEVRDRDLVLVPHGWHGPSMAAVGYDLYYLNVMAGPGQRAWHACDDPAHAWVRQTWEQQPLDPRLPLPAPAPGTNR